MENISPNQKRKDTAAIIVGMSSLAGGLAASLLIIASTPHKAASSVQKNAKNWLIVTNERLHSNGFGFVNANYDNGILTLNGDTQNSNARINAFETLKKIISEEINGDNNSGQSNIIALENHITVNGEKISSVPDTASTLKNEPKAEACQLAYDTLLKGNVINFNSASAIITPDSEPLLNSLSQVAIKCVNYKVEVGGHTDAIGDAGANQVLSERRAQAVADYLVRQGVNASELSIKGYGEAEPLDKSATTEADAKNRRIEFKVFPKEN